MLSTVRRIERAWNSELHSFGASSGRLAAVAIPSFVSCADFDSHWETIQVRYSYYYEEKVFISTICSIGCFRFSIWRCCVYDGTESYLCVFQRSNQYLDSWVGLYSWYVEERLISNLTHSKVECNFDLFHSMKQLPNHLTSKKSVANREIVTNTKPCFI